VREDGSASERENVRLGTGEHVGGDVLLDHAEGGLSLLLEGRGDGRSHSTLDLGVEIDERAPKALGYARARRRLARAHEARDREVAA
jgi:hypothetical protein